MNEGSLRLLIKAISRLLWTKHRLNKMRGIGGGICPCWERAYLSFTLNSCKLNCGQMADRRNQICSIVCQSVNIHEKVEGNLNEKIVNFSISCNKAIKLPKNISENTNWTEEKKKKFNEV
jgi:hypothetical protein